ncbi:MAG: hypothetical protein R8M11_00955 [Gallionella sp.]
MRRSPGLTGVQQKVVAKQSIDRNADDGALDWDWALQEMDALLPRYSEDRPNVTVVLSNHFVHYALVPWNGLISSDEEHLAYARHHFEMTYGKSSATWDLRLNQLDAGAAQLASAVPEPLLMACSEMVKRHGLQLESVQPYFMSAFNQYKSQIQRADAWFALVEPGAICLAHIKKGQWMRMRTARLDKGWDAFARFMAREAFMDDREAGAEEPLVYVCAPHIGGLQTIDGWEIHELPSHLPANIADERDNSLVMALSG